MIATRRSKKWYYIRILILKQFTLFLSRKFTKKTLQYHFVFYSGYEIKLWTIFKKKILLYK